MGSGTEIIKGLREPTKALREQIPDVYAGFGAMHDGALTDGDLSVECKELIALAIAVVKRCSACIAYHAKALARLGANAEEVAEAIGVAILMDGGPAASGYGPEAYDRFVEFAGAAATAAVAGGARVAS